MKTEFGFAVSVLAVGLAVWLFQPARVARAQDVHVRVSQNVKTGTESAT